MKKWLFFSLVIAIVGAIAAYEQSKKYRKQWEIAMANVKSYDALLGKEGNKNIALQLTIDQLNNYQDSILRELNATRKKLKIKDSKLNSMQYVASDFSKVDTVILKDTLFKEPSINIDTLLKDQWYQLHLGLKYPSMVIVEPVFKSEKHIIVSSKKETVNPPKKFFLFRWFQKKHILIHIDVVEKNPYVNNEKNRYIEIVK